MTTAAEATGILDGDSHVLEPPDLWDRYIDPSYRNRSIRIFRNEQGKETLTVDNRVLLQDHLGGLGGVEIERERLSRPGEVSYLEGAPPASMDTDARIRLYEDWGIRGGVVFPTVGILWDTDDPLLADAYARAYNRWLWDFAGGHEDRILPIAHIPFHDPELALAELRRCLKLGFRGMFLAPEPVGGKRPSHPDFDAIWHELEDAELPFCLHVIVRFNRPVGLGQGLRGWFPEGNRTFVFGLGATFQIIPAVAALVMDGLFDRFPRLKCYCVEAGCGWAPYLMDRLDEKHQFFGYADKLKLLPSEYLRRNVWYAAEPTERTINAVMDLVDETHVLWGSDYPHIDSHIEAATQIRASVAGLSEKRRRLVLGENARALFRLD
jgi:predicted TIM-barrel fold metal-dependent hydrolase